jgi:hypothetical protein
MDSSGYDVEEDYRPPARSQSAGKQQQMSNDRHDSDAQSRQRTQQYQQQEENSFSTPFNTSQQSFPSDLLTSDSPFLNEATKPLPKQLTMDVVEVVKIASVLASVAGCIYFYLSGDYDVVLEYDQVVFLSVLINILDSRPGFQRKFWFFAIILAGISWSMMAVYMATWDLPIYHSVAWAVMAFCYDSGTIACAHVILQHPSRKLRTTNFLELDLLLYLVTLNVICVFPIYHFNSSLHMILDIRMIIMLYTGLYRPHDKIALLRRKSLWFIMFCILAFFILDSMNSAWCQFAASLINIGLGLTLFAEAMLFHYVKYPRMRKMQAAEDEEALKQWGNAMEEGNESESLSSAQLPVEHHRRSSTTLSISRSPNAVVTAKENDQENPILANCL